MSQEEQVIFDPTMVDVPRYLLGVFPMYVVSLVAGNKLNSGVIPVNVTFKFANLTDYTGENEDGEEFDASYMTGDTIGGRTLWYNPKPTERWHNEDFFKWCRSAGVVFEEVKGKGVALRIPDEEEVYGLPFLGEVKDIKRNNGDVRREVDYNINLYTDKDGNPAIEPLDYNQKLLNDLQGDADAVKAEKDFKENSF